MSVITHDDLRKSGDLFEESLKPLRAMVHRVCKLTGAQATCPYLQEHGDCDTETCRTCPLKKERANEQT